MEFKLSVAAGGLHNYSAFEQQARDCFPAGLELDCQYIAMLSSDPPRFLRLLGKSAAWTGWLGKAAAALMVLGAPFYEAYLATMGEKVAKAHWDRLSETANPRDVAEILKACEALDKAAALLPGGAKLSIGLDIPDDFVPTALELSIGHRDRMFFELTQFVASCPEIEKMVSEIAEGDKAPLTGVFVEILGIADIKLSWHSDNQRHEARIRVNTTAASATR